jgi:acetyltransferase-like isoleucine patch superfamily enzyme
LNRVTQIGTRYGWRTPLVVLAVAWRRWVRVSERLTLVRFKLLTKGKKGRRIRLGRHVGFVPGSFLSLGDDLYIGDRCTFEIYVNSEARVSIGSNTWLSRDLHLQCAAQVTIGRNVLVGEFVSIRDTTHSYLDPMVPIKNQTDVSSPVIMEDDVWIGRGCLIQAKAPGIVIGRGAIVGANSVVTSSIPPMEVWGGTPAKMLKQRPF